MYACRVSAVWVPVLNSPSGLPSTSRGPSLKTWRLSGAIVVPWISIGAGASPGCPSSWNTCTTAATSGCGFEITTANCCAAALLVGLIIALSRSTAQYSQPTLLRWVVARLQRLKHAPLRQAIPWLVSQVAVRSPLVPSALHARTLSPSQVGWLGMHSVQAKRLDAQTFPAAVQSAVVTHAAVLPSHFWSCPTAQRCDPTTHTGSGGGLSGSGCQRAPESKQLGAASPPPAPARRSHARLKP